MRRAMEQLAEAVRKPVSSRGRAMEQAYTERRTGEEEPPRPLGSRTWDDLAREQAIVSLSAYLAEGLAKANAPGQELSERFAQAEELIRETLLALEDVTPGAEGE